jgi:hypothetical protein
MTHRRALSAWLAVLLTATLAYSYAGPVICAGLHGHDGPGTAHQHAAARGPAGQDVLGSAADHTGGCPDMEHCHLGLVAPISTGTPVLAIAPLGLSHLLPPPAVRIGTAAAPATPPPRA